MSEEVPIKINFVHSTEADRERGEMRGAESKLTISIVSWNYLSVSFISLDESKNFKISKILM